MPSPVAVEGGIGISDIAKNPQLAWAAVDWYVMTISSKVSGPGVWFFAGFVGVAAAQAVGCSSEFRTCYETRTCPPRDDAGGTGDESGGRASGGRASGGRASGGTATGAGGANGGINATSNEAGEGGATDGQAGQGEIGGDFGDAGAGGRGGTAATVGTSGGAGMPTGGNAGSGPVDNIPPTILSITPTNGATQLTTSTDTIVVTFSEPMNEASTEAAYTPAAGSPTPAFAWNKAGTVLTIDPKLAYPSATDPSATGTPFIFSISKMATDLAGNALPAAVDWQFTLLREVTQVFNLVSGASGATGPTSYVRGTYVLAGDSSSNNERRAFITFDISGMPASVKTIESATLTSTISGIEGDAFGTFGNLLIQSVSYSDFSLATFATAQLHDLGVLIAANSAHIVGTAVSKDVLVALSDDYANRATRGSVSQFRLIFAGAPNSNSAWDDVQLANNPDGTQLTVRYLYP